MWDARWDVGEKPLPAAGPRFASAMPVGIRDVWDGIGVGDVGERPLPAAGWRTVAPGKRADGKREGAAVPGGGFWGGVEPDRRDGSRIAQIRSKGHAMRISGAAS